MGNPYNVLIQLAQGAMLGELLFFQQKYAARTTEKLKEVHTLVNGKSNDQIQEIKDLKADIAALKRQRPPKRRKR